MGRVKVPRGWKRTKVEKRIVYESCPPRVKIWKIDEFDKFKLKGRFVNVDRKELNFSVKMDNDSSEDSGEENAQDDELAPASSESMDTSQHNADDADTSHIEFEAIREANSVDLGALHKQRFKVDNTVRQLTKDSPSALDHGSKLKEASAKLNNLRHSSSVAEISLDNILKAIKDCDTSRFGHF